MALAAVSAVIFLSVVWARHDSGIPSWVIWEDSVIRDSTGKYVIELSDRSVSVKCDVNIQNDTNVKSNMSVQDDINVIWTSPSEVKVQRVLSCDIDNDKTDELVLLCWKRGRYGEHKPFWIEKDEDMWSQHLFVYEYNSDQISPKWMSSYMGQDVADITSNGKEAPHARL